MARTASWIRLPTKASWWIVLTSFVVGSSIGLALGATVLRGCIPDFADWLKEVSIKNAGFWTCIAALVALTGILWQVNRSKRVAAAESWWRTFEWASVRAVPLDPKIEPLPPEMIWESLLQLLKAAPTAAERAACRGIAEHTAGTMGGDLFSGQGPVGLGSESTYAVSKDAALKSGIAGAAPTSPSVVSLDKAEESAFASQEPADGPVSSHAEYSPLSSNSRDELLSLASELENYGSSLRYLYDPNADADEQIRRSSRARLLAARLREAAQKSPVDVLEIEALQTRGRKILRAAKRRAERPSDAAFEAMESYVDAARGTQGASPKAEKVLYERRVMMSLMSRKKTPNSPTLQFSQDLFGLFDIIVSGAGPRLAVVQFDGRKSGSPNATFTSALRADAARADLYPDAVCFIISPHPQLGLQEKVGSMTSILKWENEDDTDRLVEAMRAISQDVDSSGSTLL